MNPIQELSTSSQISTSTSLSKKEKNNTLVNSFFDILCKPYSIRQILINLYQIELNINQKIRSSTTSTKNSSNASNIIEEIEQLWLESLARKDTFKSFTSSPYHPLEKFQCNILKQSPLISYNKEYESLVNGQLNIFINSTYPLNSPFFICKCNTSITCPCPCVCPSRNLTQAISSTILPDLTSSSEILTTYDEKEEKEEILSSSSNLSLTSSNYCIRHCLYQFYNQFQGDSWKNSYGWKLNNRICFLPPILYDGISANYENPYDINKEKEKYIEINSITLPGNGLYGKLFNNIYKILVKNGRVLDLNFNLISGTINKDFLLLPNLQILSIKGNLLSGGLGGEIIDNNDENLESKDVKSNKILMRSNSNTSSILNGDNITNNNLPDLLPTNFNNNDMPTSTSPHITSFHQFLLMNNYNKITNLIHLDLSYNEIEGLLPACFHLYPYLEILNLSGNNFEGELPLNLSLCRYLKELRLQDNQFYGEIPNEYQELINLEVVDLSKNQFTKGLNVFTSLPRLRHLQLDYNEFEEPVHEFFSSSSTTLRYLNLSYNFFYGSILEDNIEQSNSEFQHFESQMDGVPLPSTFLNENSIEFLNTKEKTQPNPIKNQISSNSTNLLSSSSFYTNSKDKSLLNSQSLPNFPVLPSSSVSIASSNSETSNTKNIENNINNRLNFTNLVYLNLSNNYLDGKLPSELFLLKKIQFLYLHNNRFTGPLPYNASVWQNQPINKDNVDTFNKALPSLVDFTWFRSYPSENLQWPQRIHDHQGHYRVLYDSLALGIDNIYWNDDNNNNNNL